MDEKDFTDGQTYFEKILSDSILRDVLKENLGLAKTHSPENTKIIFASPDRVEAAKRAYGGSSGKLEYWPVDEDGLPGFAHPLPGKTVLEIYDKELMNNPDLLKNAVYGDLMHGMKNDPTYSSMREEFKKYYTPEESKRMADKRSWWEDANGKDPNDIATTDAYIRGWMNENDIAIKGHKQYGGTMYSPQQLELLKKMQRYIKEGK